MSLSSWLVAGIVPGIERHPLKKLKADAEALLRLLQRWRDEATKAGRTITSIAVAFETGRDGFWLARWLRARDIEAYAIHATSVAVSREHRRHVFNGLPTTIRGGGDPGVGQGFKAECKNGPVAPELGRRCV